MFVKNRLALMVVMTFLSAACRQEFEPFLQKAEKSFAAKNYINTIDSLNLGLPHWRSSDGAPKKARAYDLMGRSFQGLRNTDKAIDAYQQSVQIAPEYNATYNLGNLYLLKGQPKLAMGSFQQALRARPDDPQALLGLANCLYSLHRYKEAAQTFQRIIDVSPAVTEALESLAALRSRRR